MKVYKTSAPRTKRRKARESTAQVDSEELLDGVSSRLFKRGKRDASHVVTIAASSPKKAKKMRLSLEDGEKTVKMSEDDAVLYLVEASLTARQYKMTRAVAPSVFPPYRNVALRKELSYPANIAVTGTTASVPLKDLMVHTSKRILEIIKHDLGGK